jgi:hypothetical protein
LHKIGTQPGHSIKKECLLEVEDRPSEIEFWVAEDLRQYLPLCFTFFRQRLLEQVNEDIPHISPVSTESPLCGAARIVRAIYKVSGFSTGMYLLAACKALTHTSANAIGYCSAASLAEGGKENAKMTGDRMKMLMLTLPFMVRDLIAPEVHSALHSLTLHIVYTWYIAVY